jgi:gliding motility-associated-like protein
VYKVTGTYSDTLKTVFNCDSIIITNLTVRPPAIFQQAPVICQGDSIKVGSKVYKVSGNYIDTLKTVFNCDSIIITTLTVNPVFNISKNVSICNGSSYTVGNNTYTTSGIFRDTLRTIRNCDSIITTNLTVLNEITFSQNIFICEGQSYTIGNNTYSVTGIYRDTLQSSGGCDSIVITNLTVGNKVNVSRQVSICAGEIFQFGDTILLTAGVYTQTFQGTSGCDSIITLTLSINPTKETTINRTACQGDTIVIRGTAYTQSGIIRFTEKTFQGCDSIISYVLVFNRRDNISRNVVVCVPGNFEGVPVNRDTVIVRRLKNIFNCDSIVTNNIRAAFPDEVAVQSSKCFGTLYEGFIIRRDTVIQKSLINIDGCDSLVTESITALPLPVLTVSRDTTINPGSSVSLFASGAVSYQWSTGQQGAAIIVNPLESTVYTVTGTGENGCSASAQIRVDVNACKVEIPTLFTPNGDGIHDRLVIKGGGCLADFKLTILNRWGNILFETDDISNQWDGTHNGTPVAEGVYFFVISAREVNTNVPVLEKGYVHVKR